jgi:biotin transport system substrate-specific component
VPLLRIHRAGEILMSKPSLSARSIAAVALMAAFTALASWCSLRIPVSPLPITLQTLLVLLSGFILGPRLGPLSQAVYLLMGCAGLPVFSEFSGGAGALLGPTGGFLAGFIPASFVSGLSARLRPRASFSELVVTSFLAMTSLYVPGLLWLRLYFSADLQKGLFVAIFPFLPGDILKVIICAALVMKMRNLMGEKLTLFTGAEQRQEDRSR